MSRLRRVVLYVIAKEAAACLCLLERFHVSRAVALSKHIGGFSKCGFSLKLGDWCTMNYLQNWGSSLLGPREQPLDVGPDVENIS